MPLTKHKWLRDVLSDIETYAASEGLVRLEEAIRMAQRQFEADRRAMGGGDAPSTRPSVSAVSDSVVTLFSWRPR